MGVAARPFFMFSLMVACAFSSTDARDATAGVGDADIAVSVVALPNPVAPGTDLYCNVRLANNGPDTADSVQLSFNLTPSDELTITLPPGWQCRFLPFPGLPPSPVAAFCEGPSLAPGAVEFSFVMRIPADEFIPPACSASGGSVARDPNPSNNSAEITVALGVTSGVPMLPRAAWLWVALAFAALGAAAVRSRS